ncbi:hypothetical protein BDP81DRAFT_388261 [Colletotrichum phormii]|uniref:Uncharacterized protein n=1 Tax=Colletotrichum phormii TaxID=359342 RepID=A0AAJ0EKK9_9PEZI|nr:uncharacterized protein BDP81DRAFT_388261 [Colletotrichum phormii]KAK1655321.1 hypothetical protein BDP81DRAFT_388261 [Colletotrichum phormii]
MQVDGRFSWMQRQVWLVTFDDVTAEIVPFCDRETARGGVMWTDRGDLFVSLFRASETCFDVFADSFLWVLIGVRGGRDLGTVETGVRSYQDFGSSIASRMETRRRRLDVLLDYDLAGAWVGIRAASPQCPCHEIDHESLPCTCRDGKATAMLGEVALCYVRVFWGGFGRKAATCREGGRAVCCLAICLILSVDVVEAKEICGSVSLLDQLCLGLCAHRLVCGRLSWRHVEGGCGGRTPSLTADTI